MNWRLGYLLLTVFIVFGEFNSKLIAQGIHHWETIVYAEDEWNYYTANAAPPTDWNEHSFNDDNWATGIGGFGYNDGDDNTIVPSGILTIYIRHTFNITNKDNIAQLLLDADYDDGYVAFLNGVEIARANVGNDPIIAHQQTTPTDHEAGLYQGILPERVTLSPQIIEDVLTTGENTLAIQIHNAGTSSSDLSSNFYLHLGITDTSFDYGNPPTWFEAPFSANLSSNLPIVSISTINGQPIVDEPKITAQMGIINNENGVNQISDPFNEYDGFIGIEIRGSSSAWFDKKGYGFETRDENGENNNVNLLGMPKENDWVLHGPYSDKSLMRNALTYIIAGEIMEYAPRVRFCELVLNGDYKGVYVLTEKIKRDDDRVDIRKMTEDDNSGEALTGGYIIKIDKFTGAANDGWASNYPPYDGSVAQTVFLYHYPKPDEITAQQKNYIQNYMHNFEDALKGSNYQDPNLGYRKYLDMEAFRRFWMINEIAKNVDGYRLSTYMYKERDSLGGKLHLGPVWDFNLSFGNADYCTSGNPEGWVYSEFNELCGGDIWNVHFWWDRIFTDSSFRQELVDDWQNLRMGVLSDEALTGKIDSMAQLLQTAQVRNYNRWNVLGQYLWPNYYIGATWQDEVDFLRQWTLDRLAWMDNNIDDLSSLIELPSGTTVAPNPMDTYLKVDFWAPLATLDLQFNLCDAMGKRVYTHELRVDQQDRRQTFILNDPALANLPTGLYFYYVTGNDNSVHLSGKLMKR